MKNKGFTLIELLVVVAIIGVLATIIISSLGDSRVRALDGKRLTAMGQIEIALEMYYLDNGGYPPYHTNTRLTPTNVPEFETALAPYMNIDLNDKIYGPWLVSGDPEFRYKSHTDNNYQMYGMSIFLLDSSNDDVEDDDGGFYGDRYETGPTVRYCADKYGGQWGSWHATVCVDGN